MITLNFIFDLFNVGFVDFSGLERHVGGENYISVFCRMLIHLAVSKGLCGQISLGNAGSNEVTIFCSPLAGLLGAIKRLILIVPLQGRAVIRSIS